MELIQYHKACIHCLTATEGVNVFMWNSEDTIIPKDKPTPSHEFHVMMELKKEFWRKNILCEYCGSIGSFDFWDITVDTNSLFERPDDGMPCLSFQFSKKDNELDGHMEVVTPGNNLTMLSLHELAIKGLKGHPDNYFKRHDNGFINIVVFSDPASQKCLFHSLRFCGFSKNEIVNLFIELRDKFKKDAGIFW
jgi:hypothetical protein